VPNRHFSVDFDNRTKKIEKHLTSYRSVITLHVRRKNAEVKMPNNQKRYVTLFEGPDHNTPNYNLSCDLTALDCGGWGLFRDDVPKLRSFAEDMGIELTHLREFLNARDWISELFDEFVTDVQGGCGFISYGRGFGQPKSLVEIFGENLQDMLLELKHFFKVLEEIEALDYDATEHHDQTLDDFWYNAKMLDHRKVGEMIKEAEALRDSLKKTKHKVEVVYTLTRTVEVEASSLDEARRRVEKNLPTSMTLLGAPEDGTLIATFSHFKSEEGSDASR
jgi:hypothetical protein